MFECAAQFSFFMKMENVNKQMLSTASTHSCFQNWMYYSLFSVLSL